MASVKQKLEALTRDELIEQLKAAKSVIRCYRRWEHECEAANDPSDFDDTLTEASFASQDFVEKYGA